MVLANIPIQGWIVDPNVQSFFYCSFEVLVLSSHNVEILNTYAVTNEVLFNIPELKIRSLTHGYNICLVVITSTS